MQHIFAISGFINFIVSIFISFFVFIKQKSRSNIIFSILTFSTAFWSFGYWRWLLEYTDYQKAVFWLKFLTIGSIWIPILFTHWVLVFLKINTFRKFNQIVIILSYILGTVFSFINIFTNLMVDSVEKKGYFVFWPNAGHYYIYYIIFVYILLTIYTGLILLKYYKRSTGASRNQIKYLSLGCLVALLGGFFNFFLWYDINILPYGNFIIPIYPVLITYAIIKYRLMNIRFVLTRSILYGILVATVAAFFALSIVWTGNIIGGNTQASKIIIYIIDSFLVVIFLDPLKRFLARVTDTIFYKDKINYQVVLQEASNIAAREIDLQIMLDKLTRGLADKLKIKQVLALVPQNDKHLKLIAVSDAGVKELKVSDNFREYLNKHADFAITEELIRDLDRLPADSGERAALDAFIKEAENLKIEMTIPVVEQGRLTAIFLFSAKNSGDLYSQDDINFFKILTPQIATAIEKSKLYEELQEANRGLQAKVDERTKSLREANLTLEDRNKFLTTMQVVTNEITRTLDLGKVYQMIADRIASELGYVGGILSFIDEKTNSLRLAAITQNAKTNMILKMLPQDVGSYQTSLDNGGNLGRETVLSGRIQFSDRLSDFLSPPVPKDILDKIQERLGIKTTVGVPIFSETKIIGVIRFFLAHSREKISATDIETMTALTNQVGIVSRNLRLYKNLQQANVDLQDANLKLKELDKAKSEFLSIASHQLRTPISALKGYLSMMIDGDFGPVPEKIKKVAKDLFESSSRLARLVNIFLNVSRIESGRLKLEKHPLQITNLIDSVITELSQQASQKNLKISFNRPKRTAPLVLADSDKLREVILNLVDNAIKYTPQGSISISLEHDNNFMTFISQDTGIGIDPVEAPNLFRKFVRGSGVAQIHTGGSGLGLFIAQKIIKEHGGAIWAESQGKDKGSTFKFTVPLFKEGEK